MEQQNFEQTAQYHAPLEPHGFHISSIVLVIFGVVIAALVIVGAIVDTQQVADASTILIQIVAVLAIGGLPAAVIGAVWHKAYLDRIKRRHARIDLQAKEEQLRRENEAHQMRMHLAATRLFADERGNRPFIYEQGQVLQIASGNYVQPVPNHLHNEYNYSDTSTRAGQEAAAANAAAAQAYGQPLLETIIEELIPNRLEFAFGLDPITGQLVKTTLPKAVHVQLLGSSGQGKSRQATSTTDASATFVRASHSIRSRRCAAGTGLFTSSHKASGDRCHFLIDRLAGEDLDTFTHHIRQLVGCLIVAFCLGKCWRKLSSHAL